MIFYIFLGIGLIFLVGGIIFIVRGFQTENIEPINISAETVEVNLPTKEIEPADKKSNLFSKHLIKENLTTDSSESKHTNLAAEIASNPTLEYQQKIIKLEEENKKLNEALKREILNKNHDIVVSEEVHHNQEKDSHLLTLQNSLQRLTEKNYQLEKDVDEQKIKYARMEENFSHFKSETDRVIREEKEKNKILEAEIHQMEDEKRGSLNYQVIIEDLNREKQLLQENAKSYEEKIRDLEKTLELIRLQDDHKLDKANELIEAFKVKEQEFSVLQTETLTKQLAQSVIVIEDLKKENEELIQVKGELYTSIKKLTDYNLYLVEKEKFLQYELTKNKAQALGLERICEDFKIQIDDMSRIVVDSRKY